MDAQSLRPPVPGTFGEARQADISLSTRTAVSFAAALALTRRERFGQARPIGLSDIIAGIVVAGAQNRGTFSVVADELETLVGRSRIEQAMDDANARSDAPTTLPLSPLLQEAFAVARGLASVTVARSRIDARHLLAALIAAPNTSMLTAALRRVWWRDWSISPDSLRAPVLAAIERNPESGENLGAWRRILAVPTVAPAAFAADAPRVQDDALGRRGDAKRLAELACLADNAPPLAIGLFGDWGSGKSTFMAMMQGEVARIGAAWKDDPASPFATRVAQIRFNAWSFADANLWASLAVEIFEGLRDELARIEGTGDEASHRASTLLAEISARTDAAKLARKGADDAVREAQTTLAGIDTKLKAIDEKLMRPVAALAERSSSILLARHEDVSALLRDLGALKPGETATAQRLAEEALTLAASGRGSLAILRRVVKLASTRLAMTLGAAAALAVAVAWFVPPGALQAVAAFVAFAAPFVGRVVAALNRLSPLLDAVEAEEKAEADLRRERAALADARSAAAQALVEREAAAAKALTGLDAIEKAAATPQAMLRFFLNESDELRGYQQEIGLVGRLRRSFQRLDDLMAAQRDPRRTTRTDLPVLDRIILYIDDLDRLREDQVVKVLEAVALLLQFRLFVVVVAVDARWLEGALRRYYAGQLGGEGQAGPGDYLEKIFQVPFWLPRLAPGGDGFAGLARVLLPEGMEVPQEPTLSSSSPKVEAVQGEFTIDPDELPQPGDETPVEMRAAEVKRVTLTKPEAEVLAALMPLAATGPRGAKRFVNLYRLARASRSDEELRRFLGEDSARAAFPGLAFALALSCSCTAEEWQEVVTWYRRPILGVEEQVDDAKLAVAWSDVLLRPDAWRDDSIRLLNRLTWNRLGALRDLPDGLAVLTFGMVRDALAEAARYSFHAPRLDRVVTPHESPAEQPGGPA